MSKASIDFPQSHAAKLSGALLAIVLGLAPLSAMSKNQTVEGAQEFLALTLPSMQIYPAMWHIAGEKWGYDHIRDQGGRNGRVDISGVARVAKVEKLNRCVSKISVDIKDVKVLARWSGGREYIRNNMFLLISGWNSPNTEQWLIDWGKHVAEVKAEYSSVRVEQKSGRTFTVHTGAGALANRVAYAMEFLRIHCDKAAATGF